MTRRGSDSFSISSYGLGPITFRTNEVHPQEWTLPHEHKIEKREDYSFWFTDIQASIINCAKNMTALLEEFPHPNTTVSPEEIAYSRSLIDHEEEKLNRTISLIRHDPNPVVYRILTTSHDDIDYKQ